MSYIHKGNKDVAELLILKGANVNSVDNMNTTPLTHQKQSRLERRVI